MLRAKKAEYMYSAMQNELLQITKEAGVFSQMGKAVTKAGKKGVGAVKKELSHWKKPELSMEQAKRRDAIFKSITGAAPRGKRSDVASVEKRRIMKGFSKERSGTPPKKKARIAFNKPGKQVKEVTYQPSSWSFNPAEAHIPIQR